MKSLKLNVLVGLVVGGISVQATAETQNTRKSRVAQAQTNQNQALKPKQQTGITGKKVAARNPASNGDIRVTGQTPQEKVKNWELSISLLAGYSQAMSSDTTAQNMRDAGNYNRNGYGGLSVDLKFQKYLGVEAEGFFGTGKSADSAQVDRINGVITQNSRKLSQYGGMAAVKGQVPIQVGRGWIAPKAGVGYGMLTVKEMTTDLSGNEGQSKVEAKAPYGLIGVDTELVPKVIISGDFAMSFSGNGTQSTTTAGSTTPTELETQSAQFYRIRAGLYYRFTPSFLAGAQYNRRQLKYTATGSTTETTENLDQYLGVIGVTF